MANPKILATNLSTYTFTSASGSDASYPLTNLSDYQEDTFWASADSTHLPQQLMIDFGSAKSCNAITIANHNFYNLSDGIIWIQGADDNVFVTNVTTPFFTGSSSEMWTTSSNIIQFTSTLSRRYWRILFTGTTLNFAPHIGNVFLDSFLEFSTPYDFGYKKDNVLYNTVQTVALDGRVRSSQVYSGRYVWELAFKLQNEATASGFRNFLSVVKGRLNPFYLVDIDGTTFRYLLLTEDYVPLTTSHYGMNDVNLRMVEPRATR